MLVIHRVRIGARRLAVFGLPVRRTAGDAVVMQLGARGLAASWNLRSAPVARHLAVFGIPVRRAAGDAVVMQLGGRTCGTSTQVPQAPESSAGITQAVSVLGKACTGLACCARVHAGCQCLDYGPWLVADSSPDSVAPLLLTAGRAARYGLRGNPFGRRM